MNKKLKILLAILAGIDAVFYMITPIFIAIIMISLTVEYNIWSTYLIYSIALLSTLFRGIKIGWLKKDE